MATLEEDSKVIAKIHEIIDHLQNQINFHKKKQSELLRQIEPRVRPFRNKEGECPSFILSGIGAFHWLKHPEGSQFLFVPERN